jgi:hypothetical protein
MRLIDADKIRWKSYPNDYGETNDDYVEKCDIDNMPTVDAVPVVHGRWISFLDGDHIMPERYYRCSRCGRVESRRQPYCHCGAKMDGGDNTER